MGAHCIRLEASGRAVTVSSYVAAVRHAKANPSAMYRHGLCTWHPVTGAEIVREFQRGCEDRTNRQRAHYGKGRKWADGWQRATRRVADSLASRVIVRERECPPELRSRLAHRLYGPDDL